MNQNYGPALIDHALEISGLDPQIVDFSEFTQLSESIDKLFDAFKICDQIIAQCSSGDTQKGYILANNQDNQIQFEDFQPFQPASIQENQKLIEFESFDSAVDEYFSKIESQKLQAKAKQAEDQALKKLEKVKSNNASQIKNLQISQERKNLMAQAIEYNLDLVDACIKTICSFVASGMDWEDLKALVAEERSNGNPLALAIVDLKLQSGLISVALPDPSADHSSDSDDSDSSENADHTSAKANRGGKLIIDLDIYESAFANARNYYDAKKLAISKEQKTIQASFKAIEHAEKRIMETLHKKEAQQTTISKFRPPFWFERFLWFITTENYLVIGGRDAQQAEQLVTRFMKPEDIYVSADMDGSACVLVKPLPGSPATIPPTTLLQAGTMSVCHSKAWDAKIVTSAFWIKPTQVLKTTNAGLLAPGVIEITGKKNYLPPVQLVYGIALLFQVEESCVANHYSERRPWGRDGTAISVDVIDINRAVDLISTRDEEEPAVTAPELSQADISNIRTTSNDEIVAGIELEESVKEEDHRSITTDADSKTHTKLSAKQRRDLKKGRAVNNSTQEVIVQPPTNEETPSESALLKQNRAQSVSSSTENLPNKPLPRGKKSKLKKINTKYADQDEEDRAIALELSGSAKGPTPKGKKAKAQAAKEMKAQAAKEIKAVAAQDQSHQPKPHPKPEKKLPETLPEVEIPETILDDLTGQPLDSDVLLNCIPVCAPWIALQKYKYKIKIMPGSLKRGKAAKQVLNSFTSLAKSETEVELIKLIPESEWITTMLSKVKLVISDKK